MITKSSQGRSRIFSSASESHNDRHDMSNAPTDGTSGSHAHGVSRLYRRATADKPRRGSEKMPCLKHGIEFTRRELVKEGLGLAGIIMAGKAPAAIVKSLVGAKETGFSDDASGWKNPYVDNGLVSFIDAEWNESPLVHNSSMIGANDLIGGEYALTQYANFPYLENNGNAWVKSSNASLILDKSGILSFPTKEFSVQFCCYFSYNGIKFIIGKKFTTSYGAWEKRVELAYQRLSCGTNYSWANYNFSQGWQYHSMAVTGQSPNLISLYVDGIRVQSNKINEYDRLMSTVDYLMFGGSLHVPAGSNIAEQCSAGTLYHNCLIYNRALTAEEIAHNYAVDKERFGL